MTRAVFWQPDKQVDDLARRPEWCRLMRESSKAGVSFALVRSEVGYGCEAFHLEKISEGRFRERPIAKGEASTPVEAVLAAFDRARAAGWPLDPSWAAALRPDQVEDLIAELVG